MLGAVGRVKCTLIFRAYLIKMRGRKRNRQESLTSSGQRSKLQFWCHLIVHQAEDTEYTVFRVSLSVNCL